MGAAAVWCSHPAAFSLARAEIVFRVSTRTERRRIIRLAFVLAMGAASFLLLYFVSLRQLAKDSAQFDFWGQLFPPTGIRSHGRMPFRCVRRVRPRRDSPGFREWPFRGRGCGTVSDQPWARLDGLRVMHRYASSYVCPSISTGRQAVAIRGSDHTVRCRRRGRRWALARKACTRCGCAHRTIFAPSARSAEAFAASPEFSATIFVR